MGIMRRWITYILLGALLTTSYAYAAAFAPSQVRARAGQTAPSLRVITAENAEHLQRLSTLGLGVPTDVAWSPKGETFAVATSLGGWVYTDGFAQPPRPLTDTGALLSIAFSPDGKRIAAAGDEGVIHLWDATTLDEILTLNGHTDRIWRVVFNPQGALLASVSADGTARVWDTQTGREQPAWRIHERGITDTAFSADGTLWALSYADGDIRLWNMHAAQRTPYATLHAAEGVSGFALTPQGTGLISGGIEGAITYWDIRTGEERAIGARCTFGAVTDLALSADGNYWAASCEDGTVHIGAVDGGVHFALRGHQAGASGVAFNARGDVLASASYDGTVRLWAVPDGSPLSTLDVAGHVTDVFGLAFSPDGALLASAGADGTVRLWPVTGTTSRLVLTGHTAQVLDVAFNPSGEMLATAGLDGTVRLWHVNDGTPRAVLYGHDGGVTRVSFSRDGALLASAGWDGTVRLWDARSGEARGVLEHEVSVTDITFGAENTLATVDLNGALWLWDAASRQRVRLTSLCGRDSRVMRALFSPDGTRLAVGENDGSVCLRSPEGELRLSAQGTRREAVTGLAFSPDGSLLVVADAGGSVRTVNVETGRDVAAFDHVARTLFGVAFSADGTRIALAGEQPQIQMWGIPADER